MIINKWLCNENKSLFQPIKRYEYQQCVFTAPLLQMTPFHRIVKAYNNGL